MKNNEKTDHVSEIFARIMSVLKVGTYADVFVKIDMKRGTFDTWKQRGKIPEAKLYEIASKIGVEKKWLEHGDTDEPSFVSDIPIAYGRKNGSVSIPYHKEVYASAGGGSDATSMVGTSPITFSKEFLNNYLGIHNLQGLSIISAAGDSMKPTIKSGELMFVYPVENEGFKDGGIYVIMCGDALLVKRVWLNPVTREYTLSSDNNTVKDQVLTMDEGSDCHFVGRVVGHLDRV